MGELQDLCTQLGLNSDDSCPEMTCGIKIEFVGAKFGEELEAEYAACDLLALVSHTENFGATVVDALVHSKPVITSKATPWQEVEGGEERNEETRCGWWVENDVETLASTLRSALTTPAATLEAMGANGRALVVAKYTWSAVAKTLSSAYTALLTPSPAS